MGPKRRSGKHKDGKTIVNKQDWNGRYGKMLLSQGKRTHKKERSANIRTHGNNESGKKKNCLTGSNVFPPKNFRPKEI